MNRLFSSRLFSSQSGRHSGFTLTELMMSITLIGVLALLVIPKLIYARQTSQADALIKEAYGTIGEAYMARKTADDTPEESIGSGTGERVLFYNYLKKHLNFSSVRNVAGNPCLSGLRPSADPNTEFAPALTLTDGLFTLPNGVVIYDICESPTTGATPTQDKFLSVLFAVPIDDAGAVSWNVLVVPGRVDGYAGLERYTTWRGYAKSKGNNSVVTDIDNILNLDVGT